MAYQLNFDGVNDYLILPSLTFRAIQLWTRVDARQPNPGERYLLDARDDLVGPYLSSTSASADLSQAYVDGTVQPVALSTIPVGVWTSVYLELTAPTMAHVHLMASKLGGPDGPVGCLAGALWAVALWAVPLTAYEAAVFANGVDYFDRGEVPPALQVRRDGRGVSTPSVSSCVAHHRITFALYNLVGLRALRLTATQPKPPPTHTSL